MLIEVGPRFAIVGFGWRHGRPLAPGPTLLKLLGGDDPETEGARLGLKYPRRGGFENGQKTCGAGTNCPAPSAPGSAAGAVFSGLTARGGNGARKGFAFRRGVHQGRAVPLGRPPPSCQSADPT